MAVKKIAVIGAGVLGLSVARSLALQGAEVTIFERSYPGAGTSSTTFAWVNSNGKMPESYHQLNAAAIDEHKQLQHRTTSEGRWLIETGTYEWAVDSVAQQRLADRVAKLQQLDYPVQPITRQQLQRNVPEIRIDPRAGDLWFFPSECLLYPSIFLARLWAEARERGATLHSGSDVIDIDEQPHGVTLQLADGTSWQGDEVVLATGRWSPELMARLGLQLAMIDANQPDKIACGFLAYTFPQLTQLQANLITPELNVRPDGGGRLLLQATDLDSQANPAAPAAINGSVGQEILARYRRLFASSGAAQIERIAVGQRSRPADGLPGIGYVTPQRRVYLLVTHSGITLAPLLGRLVAEEVLQERRPALLSDFAPDRLLGKSAQDFPPFPTLHFPAAQ